MRRKRIQEKESSQEWLKHRAEARRHRMEVTVSGPQPCTLHRCAGQTRRTSFLVPTSLSLGVAVLISVPCDQTSSYTPPLQTAAIGRKFVFSKQITPQNPSRNPVPLTENASTESFSVSGKNPLACPRKRGSYRKGALTETKFQLNNFEISGLSHSASSKS